VADIRPFRGIRFDTTRVALSRVLCPPYDAILPEQAMALRREKLNAIHLELPEGEGAKKYANSARIWKDWNKTGLLRADAAPSYYVCEQTCTILGRKIVRRGFLAAMGVSERAAKDVVRHEKTLSKPKADRLNLLRATKVNISPIFGIFPDKGGAARKALASAAKRRPDAAGLLKPDIGYKTWKVDDPELVAALSRAVKKEKVLIADGHHRFEVSRAYFAQHPSLESSTVLIFLCPETDPGLVVLPTHRISSDKKAAVRAEKLCRMSACASRGAMLKALEKSKNPYAFGLYDGKFRLAEPLSRHGCRSGLCVEWLRAKIFHDVEPHDLGYTPDPALAVKMAKAKKGAAVFIRSMEVPQVRKAVAAVGLLPQKSTYFYPKIGTGVVFKPLYQP
jgi:uncharacterized protein (DUF1015 family)